MLPERTLTLTDGTKLIVSSLEGYIGPNGKRSYLLPIPLPINWRKTYESLDLHREFDALDTGAILNDNFWCMPVLKGLTIERLAKTLRKLGIMVKGERGVRSLDRYIPHHTRDPQRGNYVTYFLRYSHGEPLPDTGDLFSALAKYRLVDSTVPEYLLLCAAHILTTGKMLSTEQSIYCNGSRSILGHHPHAVHCHRLLPQIYLGWGPQRQPAENQKTYRKRESDQLIYAS